MAQPILNAPRVVAGIGQSVAASMVEHVGVDRKGEGSALAERQQTAERLADLKVQQANVEAQRARLTAEAGPALYLAKPFG